MRASLGLAAAALVAAFGVITPVAAIQNTLPPSTVALVTTWADGRTNYELTSAKRAVMWTPRFPRVDGYRPPAGTKPVYAVQFARVLVDDAIHVDVTVLLGSAAPPGVPVASLIVTRGASITVDGLTTFGVRPVTLSMATVAPLTPYLPTVVSASPQIEIASVDVLNAPYPGYRITLRDLAAKDVSTVHVQSYRGQERALSALKRSDDGRPMMTSGSTYTFDLNLTGGMADGGDPRVWTPTPLDEIEIDAVRWSDGTSDGTSPYPQIDVVVEANAGRRLQLQRVVQTMQRALDDPGFDGDRLLTLERAIADLPDAEPDQLPAAREAMRGTKAAVAADLSRVASASLPHDVARERVRALLKRYEGWLVRLSPP